MGWKAFRDRCRQRHPRPQLPISRAGQRPPGGSACVRVNSKLRCRPTVVQMVWLSGWRTQQPTRTLTKTEDGLDWAGTLSCTTARKSVQVVRPAYLVVAVVYYNVTAASSSVSIAPYEALLPFSSFKSCKTIAGRVRRMHTFKSSPTVSFSAPHPQPQNTQQLSKILRPPCCAQVPSSSCTGQNLLQVLLVPLIRPITETNVATQLRTALSRNSILAPSDRFPMCFGAPTKHHLGVVHVR